MRHPLQTWRWFRFLKTHPLLSETVRSPRRFLAKIHRPYLSNRLALTARVELLTRHYETMLNAGFGPLIKQAVREPFGVGIFTGKSGTLYKLQLSALDENRQDGELVLRLIAGNICIYSIAFIVACIEDQPQVMVGGLIGMLAVDRSMGIKQVTRDLYGCRPKDLMVTLVRDIGSCLGCSKTLLIGNHNKIPDGRRHVCRKSSDYDKNWQEMQAHMRDDGNFELPCKQPGPEITATASTGFMPQSTRRSLLIESIRRMVLNRVSSRQSPEKNTAIVSSAPIGASAHPKDKTTTELFDSTPDSYSPQR